MDEIEVKILEVDRKEIEEKLLPWGAKKIFEGELFGVILDFPDKSLTKQLKQLRLRKEGAKVKLTLKEVRSQEGVKIAKECETVVSNFDEARKIMAKLGLEELFILKKHRVSYSLGDLHFDFDKMTDERAGIPEYLEIEGPNKETIYKAAEKLGFRAEDCKAWNSTELARYYGKEILGLID